MAKNKFVVFVMTLLLLLFIGSSEAGWKFWKKDKEAITTTIAPILISVQSPTSPTPETTTTTRGQTVNTRAAATKAANPALAIDAGITEKNTLNNARSSRPNPGTEVGLDIIVPKPRQPGTDGNNRNYRDWAVSFAGAEEPSRNQPEASAQRPKINNNNSDKPNLSAVTPVPANVPTQRIQSTQPTQRTQSPQPTQPSQPTKTTQTVATRPNSVQSVQPHVTPGPTAPSSGKSRSSSPSTNSGKTWADVAAGGSRPASPGGNEQRSVPERPTQSSQSNRPASSESTLSSGVGTADLNKRTYSSNPTYSKGNTVTDEDLEKLSEALYIKETNNNANQYVTLNLQQKTTSSSPTDQAPQSLLTVNPQAFQISTIQRVLSIFDNYQLDTHTNEYISPAQREEESLLVDTFLSTNVMSTAMRFLADKGFVRKDYYEYKDTLRRIWFNLFSRGQGKIGSTGFEHVFMAETKQIDTGTEVLGLHNWIYFNAEETKRRVDYLGYIKKIDLGNKGSIIKMHARFNGHDKPVTTMFIGTSPELEMALYTLCFYTRPDGNCPVSLGGTKFNIVTRAFRYRGKNLIGTAYPDI